MENENPVELQPTEVPMQPKPNLLMKLRLMAKNKKLVLGALVLLSVLIVSGIVFLTRGKKEEQPTPTAIPLYSPEPTESPSSISTNIEEWDTYSEEDKNYLFKYPKQANLVESGNQTKLIVNGPTQVVGTEYNDAIYLSFEQGRFGGNNLKEIVDQKVAEIKKDPLSKVIKGPQEVNIGDYKAYEFQTSSLGEYTHFYLSLDNKYYLRIIDATRDPNNLGFEKVVETILSTLQSK